MTVSFLRTTALVALGLLASACNMPPAANTAPAANQAAPAAAIAEPTASQPAPAPTTGAYQVALIAGSANWSQIALRTNTATGKSDLSLAGGSFIPITDPAPVPSGSYAIYTWSTLDAGATTREWDAYRFDRQSGRLWNLAYDGVATASWTEIVAGPLPSPATPAPAPVAQTPPPAQAPPPAQ
jgi:hypothetical protein